MGCGVANSIIDEARFCDVYIAVSSCGYCAAVCEGRVSIAFAGITDEITL